MHNYSEPYDDAPHSNCGCGNCDAPMAHGYDEYGYDEYDEYNEYNEYNEYDEYDENVYDDPYEVIMYDIGPVADDVYALIEMLSDTARSWYARRRLNALAASGPLSALVAAIIIDSLGRRWNPLEHPRDRFGKFIVTGGFFRWLSNGKSFRGRVARIDSDGVIHAHSVGNDGIADGSIIKFKPEMASKLISIAEPTASLDFNFDIDAEIPNFPEASATQRRIYNALRMGDMPAVDLDIYSVSDGTSRGPENFSVDLLTLQDRGLINIDSSSGEPRASLIQSTDTVGVLVENIDDLPDDETPDLDDSPNLSKSQRDLLDRIVELDRGQGDGVYRNELTGVDESEIQSLLDIDALEEDDNGRLDLYNPESKADITADKPSESIADPIAELEMAIDRLDLGDDEEAFVHYAQELIRPGDENNDPLPEGLKDAKKRKASNMAKAWWDERNAKIKKYNDENSSGVPSETPAESVAPPDPKSVLNPRNAAMADILMAEKWTDEGLSVGPNGEEKAGILYSKQGEEYARAIKLLFDAEDFKENGFDDRSASATQEAERILNKIQSDPDVKPGNAKAKRAPIEKFAEEIDWLPLVKEQRGLDMEEAKAKADLELNKPDVPSEATPNEMMTDEDIASRKRLRESVYGVDVVPSDVPSEATPDIIFNNIDKWVEWQKRSNDERDLDGDLNDALIKEAVVAYELGLDLFAGDGLVNWNNFVRSVDPDVADELFRKHDGNVGPAAMDLIMNRDKWDAGSVSEADLPEDASPDATPPDPQSLSVDDSPAYEEIASQFVFNIAEYPALNATDGVTDKDGHVIAIGDFYRARSGGEGDFDQIVAFYDQTEFPGWLVAEAPDGKLKAVHIEGEGLAGGISRVTDERLIAARNFIKAQRQIVLDDKAVPLPQFNEGNVMSDGNAAIVGMQVRLRPDKGDLKNLKQGETATISGVTVDPGGLVHAFVFHKGAKNQNEMSKIVVSQLEAVEGERKKPVVPRVVDPNTGDLEALEKYRAELLDIFEQQKFNLADVPGLIDREGRVIDRDENVIAIGDFYASRRGGEGDFLEIIGFYDQEKYPGWVLGIAPDGKMKMVHTWGKTNKKEDSKGGIVRVESVEAKNGALANWAKKSQRQYAEDGAARLAELDPRNVMADGTRARAGMRVQVNPGKKEDLNGGFVQGEYGTIHRITSGRDGIKVWILKENDAYDDYGHHEGKLTGVAVGNLVEADAEQPRQDSSVNPLQNRAQALPDGANNADQGEILDWIDDANGEWVLASPGDFAVDTAFLAASDDLISRGVLESRATPNGDREYRRIPKNGSTIGLPDGAQNADQEEILNIVDDANGEWVKWAQFNVGDRISDESFLAASEDLLSRGVLEFRPTPDGVVEFRRKPKNAAPASLPDGANNADQGAILNAIDNLGVEWVSIVDVMNNAEVADTNFYLAWASLLSNGVIDRREGSGGFPEYRRKPKNAAPANLPEGARNADEGALLKVLDDAGGEWVGFAAVLRNSNLNVGDFRAARASLRDNGVLVERWSPLGSEFRRKPKNEARKVLPDGAENLNEGAVLIVIDSAVNGDWVNYDVAQAKSGLTQSEFLDAQDALVLRGVLQKENPYTGAVLLRRKPKNAAPASLPDGAENENEAAVLNALDEFGDRWAWWRQVAVNIDDANSNMDTQAVVAARDDLIKRGVIKSQQNPDTGLVEYRRKEQEVIITEDPAVAAQKIVEAGVLERIKNSDAIGININALVDLNDDGAFDQMIAIRELEKRGAIERATGENGNVFLRARKSDTEKMTSDQAVEALLDGRDPFKIYSPDMDQSLIAAGYSFLRNAEARDSGAQSSRVADSNMWVVAPEGLIPVPFKIRLKGHGPQAGRVMMRKKAAPSVVKNDIINEYIAGAIAEDVSSRLGEGAPGLLYHPKVSISVAPKGISDVVGSRGPGGAVYMDHALYGFPEGSVAIGGTKINSIEIAKGGGTESLIGLALWDFMVNNNRDRHRNNQLYVQTPDGTIHTVVIDNGFSLGSGKPADIFSVYARLGRPLELLERVQSSYADRKQIEEYVRNFVAAYQQMDIDAIFERIRNGLPDMDSDQEAYAKKWLKTARARIDKMALDIDGIVDIINRKAS